MVMSELANKIEEKYILKIKIEELERKLQEQMRIYQEEKRDWANVEEVLHGQVRQLKKTILEMEREGKCGRPRQTGILWSSRLGVGCEADSLTP